MKNDLLIKLSDGSGRSETQLKQYLLRPLSQFFAYHCFNEYLFFRFHKINSPLVIIKIFCRPDPARLLLFYQELPELSDSYLWTNVLQ